MLTPLADSCQFILVDDGSTDGTRSVAQKLVASRPDVLLKTHDKCSGLGRSLRTGFKAATGEAVLTLDADLTFHPTQVPALMDVFGPDTACVAGSPIRGQMEQVSPVRRWLSQWVNRFYRVLLGSEFTGVSSIFRLYRRTALSALELESESFDINAEILFKMVTRGERVREVPVRLTTRTWGRSKINVPREVKNHLRLLWRIAGWRWAARED